MQKSFTLVEVLVVLGILLILIGLTVPAFRFFSSGESLKNSAGEVIGVLRAAQGKTLASEGANQWGVYFSTSTNQYVLFRGSSYASRNASLDEPHNLASEVEIYQADLGGGIEVVFDRVTGKTNFPGNLSLRLKKDALKTETVYVEGSGRVGSVDPLAKSDANRLKDSRHVHFDYSRLIATSSETISLIFIFDSQTATTTVGIANNLKNGQIFWEGEIDVVGQAQKIKIQTHRLNNPDTQFSINRDLRYNTRALSVEISGDSSGDLVRYDADSQTIQGTSIYAANLSWQ